VLANQPGISMHSSLGSNAKELKQQGALEAAQNDNGKVTAQDAEQVLVDESRKAGAAAFQFDPDASPEEKAAQAGAVCLYVSTQRRSKLICFRYRKFPRAFIARENPESGSQLILYVLI
jgi:hypothetical protein